jgi:hypothetical protein
VVTVHSRGAEAVVIQGLRTAGVAAILHWYTGPLGLIEEALAAGLYFSINPAMLRAEKGRKVIAAVPPRSSPDRERRPDGGPASGGRMSGGGQLPAGCPNPPAAARDRAAMHTDPGTPGQTGGGAGPRHSSGGHAGARPIWRRSCSTSRCSRRWKILSPPLSALLQVTSSTHRPVAHDRDIG